jgi:hypothetical protein
MNEFLSHALVGAAVMYVVLAMLTMQFPNFWSWCTKKGTTSNVQPGGGPGTTHNKQ